MVTQILIWVCEFCAQTRIQVKEAEWLDDPVITSPDGEKWDMVRVAGGQERLACPACLACPNG